MTSQISFKDAIAHASNFNELAKVYKNSQADWSFWRGRFVTAEGYSGYAGLTTVTKKVMALYNSLGWSFALSNKPIDQVRSFREVYNQVREFWKKTDSLVPKISAVEENPFVNGLADWALFCLKNNPYIFTEVTWKEEFGHANQRCLSFTADPDYVQKLETKKEKHLKKPAKKLIKKHRSKKVGTIAPHNTPLSQAGKLPLEAILINKPVLTPDMFW